MTVVRILQYPQDRKRLARKGKRVESMTADVVKMIDDMFETHYAADNCAALAATQLDFAEPYHITVIDFSAEKNQPLCLINGEIIAREGTMQEGEACMSVPGGIYEKINRSQKIRVRALDRQGKPFELEAEDYMAKCIQHELDHLNGNLFIDRLSPLKRERVDKKILKWLREKE